MSLRHDKRRYRTRTVYRLLDLNRHLLSAIASGQQVNPLRPWYLYMQA